MSAAMLDRLLHSSVVLNLDTDFYRVRAHAAGWGIPAERHWGNSGERHHR